MRVPSFVVGLTMFTTFGTAALGATLKVPQQFATIQAAVDASNAGDTILIAPGVYEEAIDIVGGKSNLTVRGIGKVVVDARINGALGVGPAFNIGANDIRIENLTVRLAQDGMIGAGIAAAGSNIRIKNVTAASCQSAGIRIDGPFARVENCRVIACEDQGIRINGDDAFVSKCLVRQCDSGGIEIVGHRAQVTKCTVKTIEDDGAVLITGTDAKVIGNTLLDADGHAIDIVGTGFEIRGNTVRSDQDSFGIRVVTATSGVISGNTCLECHEAGIQVDSSATGIEISKNKVLRCGSETDHGIIVFGDGCSVLGNTVLEAESDGIFVTGAGVTVKGNKISTCYEDGIQITGSNCIVESNVIKGCFGEGLENNGSNTTATGNVVKGNRIDVANTGTFATFTNNQFTSGGTSTAPEIAN